MTVRATKMHGLGNDYIYVDAFQQRVADPARLARAVSDRHTGVGSDGLILIGPATEPGAHLRMRIFNADGSEAQMCGNGIRCVARYAVERGLSAANPLQVQTGRGTLSIAWRGGAAFEASVQMGAPRFACGEVPAQVPGVSASAEVLAWRLAEAFWQGCEGSREWMQACGLEGTLSLASMGNPHAVLWCRDVAAVPLERVGPFIERHGWFPERINAHFASVESPGTIHMRTWERGSGITLACGTGASAVGAVALREGRVHGPMQVHVPGGALRIEWGGGEASVVMTGPATFVADLELAAHLAAEAG